MKIELSERQKLKNTNVCWICELGWHSYFEMWWEKGRVEVLFSKLQAPHSQQRRDIFVLSTCSIQASTLPSTSSSCRCSSSCSWTSSNASDPTSSTLYHSSESRQTSKQPTGDTSIHRLKEYKFHRFFGGVNLEVDWSDSPSQTFLHHALTLLSSVHWQSPHSASRVALIL